MNLTYAYRLYVRPRERVLLSRLLEEHREVYNAALSQIKTAFEVNGERQTAVSQWAYFREWRKQANIVANASSVQQTLRRLDKAFAAFFRRLKAGETPGYPRFKGANRLDSVEYTYGDGVSLYYDEPYDRFLLHVQNVGEIKVKLHRFLPDRAQIKHVVLKRKATGWYVFLMFAVPDPLLVEPNGLPQVGADRGLLRLLTLSDGTQIDNPRWLRANLDKLRRTQRRLARAQKGGQNRNDCRMILAKRHEHIANIRRDFWHKITDWLVRHYGLIALEHLDLAFMTRNTHLSLSAHDAGLGLFNDLLRFKAVDAGCALVHVNPRNTSQQCSGCGALVPKALSVRVHSCPHCQLELDRDVNAAINILALALPSPPGSGGQVLT
ncbi:MAG: transposase [Anaerolineales bacterium]|nr:transposase [Anaerolineales bacterium]